MQRHLFFYATFALAAGIAVASFTQITPLATAFLLVLFVAIYLMGARFSLFLCVIFIMGLWRYSVQPPLEHTVALKSNAILQVRGWVKNSPLPGQSSHSLEEKIYRWTFQGEEYFDGTSWQGFHEKFLVYQGHPHPLPRRGKRVEILAKVYPIRQARNPGEIDFLSYWQAKGIRYQLRLAEGGLSYLLGERGCPMLNSLERFRLAASEFVWAKLGSSGALVIALLLGDKTHLNPGTKESFQALGLAHLLAISGLHVSLLTGFVYLLSLFVFQNYLLRVGLTLAMLLGYSLLTGMHPPVARASMVLAIYLGGQIIGRKSSAGNSLFLAAFFLLLINPHHLYSVSFQFSFLATGAILLGCGALANQKEQRQWWYEAAQISVVAWMATSPLTAYYFGYISPLGIVLSIVITPWILAILVQGFLLLFTPLGLGYVGDLLAWLLQHTIVWLEQLLMKIFALVGGKVVLLPPLEVVLMGFYTLALWLLLQKLSWQRWGVLIILWIVTLFSGFVRPWLLPEKAIWFLDVGHGNSTVLKLDQHYLMYDCGGFSPYVANCSILPFLRYHGINKLDAVILSHHDQDHYNALPELLGQIPIGEVVVNRAFLRFPSSVLAAIEEHQIPVRVLEKKTTLLPGVHLFSPGKDLLAANDNDNSLVMLWQQQGLRVLFTGDVEEKACDLMYSQLDTPVDLLVVPHHGAHLGNLSQLVRALQPRIALISAREGFAHPSTLQTLNQTQIATWQTSQLGGISLLLHQGKGKLHSFLGSESFTLVPPNAAAGETLRHWSDCQEQTDSEK